MIFFSIREFFYKLNTIGFILLLMPMVVFVLLYSHAITADPIIVEAREQTELWVVFIFFILIDLTIVHLLWVVGIRKMKGLNELATKMDRYFVLVLVRNGGYATGCLIMALGFFLTQSAYFTGMFLLIMLTVSFQWPTASRFARQLGLRGADLDMVLNNLDQERKGVKR